jgi:hypothetical protein
VHDSVVRTELVYLRAQQAKRRASNLLSSGNSEAAMNEIQQAQREIAQAQVDAPESLAADLADEAATLSYLARDRDRIRIPGRKVPLGQLAGLLAEARPRLRQPAGTPAHRTGRRSRAGPRQHLNDRHMTSARPTRSPLVSWRGWSAGAVSATGSSETNPSKRRCLAGRRN